MKNLLSFFSFVVCIGVFFYPATSHSNSSGSVGGKTGSPADVGSCTQCHYAAVSSSAKSLQIFLQVDMFLVLSTLLLQILIN